MPSPDCKLTTIGCKPTNSLEEKTNGFAEK